MVSKAGFQDQKIRFDFEEVIVTWSGLLRLVAFFVGLVALFEEVEFQALHSYGSDPFQTKSWSLEPLAIASVYTIAAIVILAADLRYLRRDSIKAKVVDSCCNLLVGIGIFIGAYFSEPSGPFHAEALQIVVTVNERRYSIALAYTTALFHVIIALAAWLQNWGWDSRASFDIIEQAFPQIAGRALNEPGSEAFETKNQNDKVVEQDVDFEVPVCSSGIRKGSEVDPEAFYVDAVAGSEASFSDAITDQPQADSEAVANETRTLAKLDADSKASFSIANAEVVEIDSSSSDSETSSDSTRSEDILEQKSNDASFHSLPDESRNYNC